MTLPVKKVKIVLNADRNAVDATTSTVSDAGVVDIAKQQIPLLRDTDTAIIGSSATRTGVELGVAVGIAYLGEMFQPVGRIKDAIGA